MCCYIWNPTHQIYCKSKLYTQESQYFKTIPVLPTNTGIQTEINTTENGNQEMMVNIKKNKCDFNFVIVVKLL